MVFEDDASDASSVTIDNDPDRRYALREDSRTTTPFLSVPPTETVDLTEGEPFHDGDYVTDEDLEILHEDWFRSELTAPTARPVSPKKRLEEICGDDGILYKPGQTVELHDDTFLRICSIWEETNGEICFQGRRMLKIRNHVGTYLPEWQNELVWIANETASIPLGFVRCFVQVHFTNDSRVSQSMKRNCLSGLFCRLKEVLQTHTTSVEYLSYEEADDGYRVKATALRRSWRGETSLFGSERHSAPVVVLDGIEDMEQRMHRKYTFGDGFCGAGGVSCGAETAGLHIKWAFDLSPHAAASYRLNFPTVLCEESDIFSFLTNNEEFLRVDVTHGSPPCQTFSPAHTVEGANDDANSACIFSCGDLIRKAKPRIHTMEETSGLFNRHKNTFFRVIQDFIETGYSVRWEILDCVKYGVPQSRKRLVVIASGPGEMLPLLPQPTHGLPGSGLRDLTTINQAILNIPPGTPDHDVERARSRGSQNQRAPFDGNQQAHTITCGGGDNNYHPSGQRVFTNREFACLQTFPLTFQFGRFGLVEVRRQIGNAVPPILAQAIYGQIVRSLQETDEREERELRERQ
ncbi:S-adenosyl-L-methionine-dependent methyltransferase [Aspergillus aurantiobrunneus]